MRLDRPNNRERLFPLIRPRRYERGDSSSPGRGEAAGSRGRRLRPAEPRAAAIAGTSFMPRPCRPREGAPQPQLAERPSPMRTDLPSGAGKTLGPALSLRRAARTQPAVRPPARTGAVVCTCRTARAVQRGVGSSPASKRLSDGRDRRARRDRFRMNKGLAVLPPPEVRASPGSA